MWPNRFPLTPFYESACDFAQRALQAHHAREFRRVALEAGTALEHLAKACLARRSPALLTELRGEGNFGSLLGLLGIPGGRPLLQLRTVGLRDALARVKTFVKSDAFGEELQALVDMRDGTVHAAMNDEVEERLLVAFVQHADSLLADLGRDREDLWADYLPVVDALLADASDKVARHVAVKLAGAQAQFERQYGEMPEEMLALLHRMPAPQSYDPAQVQADCPACESLGLMTGYHDVDVEWDRGDEGQVPRLGTAWLMAEAFACRVCGLRLVSAAELAAAHMETRLEIEEVEPPKYEPEDEDPFFEAWRESRHEREE